MRRRLFTKVLWALKACQHGRSTADKDANWVSMPRANPETRTPSVMVLTEASGGGLRSVEVYAYRLMLKTLCRLCNASTTYGYMRE